MGKKSSRSGCRVFMSANRTPSDVFQERLKAARELRGWSQEELGSKTGMPPSSIGHYESGSRKPSFHTLRKLANTLNVTTDYLLGRVDEPGLAESGDPLYRDVGKLTAGDREIAEAFLKMLAERNAAKRKV